MRGWPIFLVHFGFNMIVWTLMLLALWSLRPHRRYPVGYRLADNPWRWLPLPALNSRGTWRLRNEPCTISPTPRRLAWSHDALTDDRECRRFWHAEQCP